MSEEGADWQRLDKWLWCARFIRHRADCARLIATAALRINRQSIDKTHARVRVGDIVTLAIGHRVRVLEVRALSARRGPAAEAATLYREHAEFGGCGPSVSAAYPAATDQPAGRD